VAPEQSVSLRQLTHLLRVGFGLVTQNLPPPQSLSCVQAAQTFLVMSALVAQNAVGAEQSPLVKQPVHLFVPVLSHTILGAVTHCELAVHSTHLLSEGVAFSKHCCVLPVHWLVFVPVHVTHSWVEVAQAGFVPEQFPSIRQPTHWFSVGSPAFSRHCCVEPVQRVLLVLVQVTHLLTVVSQAGVLPEQFESLKHWTHWFRAGVAPSLHCAFGAEQPTPVTHGTQVFVAKSHAPGQSECDKHCTQALSLASALTLHLGVAPPQPKLDVQGTHCSIVPSHAGFPVIEAQSPSAAHSTQWSVPLHTGLAASLQSLWAKHSTQVVPDLHMPRTPEQAGFVPHWHCLATQALAVTMSHAVEQSPQCEKSVATFTHIATAAQHAELPAPWSEQSSTTPLQFSSSPAQSCLLGGVWPVQVK